MHAVVIQATFDDRPEAEAELPGLMSQVSSMPGFIDGYWVATSADDGIAMVVFESEDGAQAFASVARGGGPSAAVRTTAVAVGEVLGHA